MAIEKTPTSLPEFVAFKQTLPKDITHAIYAGRIPWAKLQHIDPLQHMTDTHKSNIFASVKATDGLQTLSHYEWNDPHLLYPKIREFVLATLQKGKNPVPYIRMLDAFRFEGLPVLQTLFGTTNQLQLADGLSIGVDAFSSDGPTDAFAVINQGEKTATTQDTYISLIQLHQLSHEATPTQKFLKRLAHNQWQVSTSKMQKHIDSGASRSHAFAVLQLQKQHDDTQTASYTAHIGITKPDTQTQAYLFEHDVITPLNLAQRTWSLTPGAHFIISSGIQGDIIHEAVALTQPYSPQLTSRVAIELFRQHNRGKDVFGGIAVVAVPNNPS